MIIGSNVTVGAPRECSLFGAFGKKWGQLFLRVIFIELCRRVRVKFPKS